MGMASQQRGELGQFELETMGGLLGEPVELVRCETIDVLVPAHAEIVIEGRIRTDLWEDDGPFGDYWLYYAPSRPARVFEVTAITHREDAIFHDIFNVGPEHLVLFSLGMEGVVFSQLKQVLPQVRAIQVPVCGSGNLVYVQIRKDTEGLGVNAALAALGAYRFKCAIVVDDDVDIHDDRKVLWAVMTRTQADRSFFTVPGSYVSRVDPTGYPPWQSGGKGPAVLSTRLGIDATKPLDPSFPEVAEPPRSLWAGLDLRDYLPD
jgi:2,5-furandicarboxylate decarboxylase 1